MMNQPVIMPKTFNGVHSSQPGYVSGGEDRVQWVFGGDDWTDEEMQPCIEAIVQYVIEYRVKQGDDMVNYFQFSYADGILLTGQRVYYIRRRSWRNREQAHGFDALLPRLTEIIRREDGVFHETKD